ncbi:hypothetical protein PsorP6_013624 [Peronosclerospora sorghi]|uniref:Uncharacterized protein n=1 Tax=Peronosclerospora sorghi TaxID=230839 RepID=A0ACC0VI37_9STRA|nr:hypothetical protein PsorP6_013624 [Peronosclerospora sorghi]
MKAEDWPRLVKTPASSLGGMAPVTVITGLTVQSPLDNISGPAVIEVTTLEAILTTQRRNFHRLRESLYMIHKHSTPTATKLRPAGREAADARHGAKMVQFDVGDYVLYANVWTQPTFPMVRTRPSRIDNVGVVYEIKNLIAGDVREVHASRLRFYADDKIDVTEAHVAHNIESHVVEQLVACAYNAGRQRFEVQVKLRGLDEAETHVPVVLKWFVEANKKGAVVQKMAAALGLIPTQPQQKRCKAKATTATKKSSKKIAKAKSAGGRRSGS